MLLQEQLPVVIELISPVAYLIRGIAFLLKVVINTSPLSPSFSDSFVIGFTISTNKSFSLICIPSWYIQSTAPPKPVSVIPKWLYTSQL